jgi:hypothetical protein
MLQNGMITDQETLPNNVFDGTRNRLIIMIILKERGAYLDDKSGGDGLVGKIVCV